MGSIPTWGNEIFIISLLCCLSRARRWVPPLNCYKIIAGKWEVKCLSTRPLRSTLLHAGYSVKLKKKQHTNVVHTFYPKKHRLNNIARYIHLNVCQKKNKIQRTINISLLAWNKNSFFKFITFFLSQPNKIVWKRLKRIEHRFILVSEQRRDTMAWYNKIRFLIAAPITK